MQWLHCTNITILNNWQFLNYVAYNFKTLTCVYFLLFLTISFQTQTQFWQVQLLILSAKNRFPKFFFAFEKKLLTHSNRFFQACIETKFLKSKKSESAAAAAATLIFFSFPIWLRWHFSTRTLLQSPQKEISHNFISFLLFFHHLFALDPFHFQTMNGRNNVILECLSCVSKIFGHTFFLLRIDIIIFFFARNPKKDHTKYFKKMSTFDKNKTVFFSWHFFPPIRFPLLEELWGVVPYPEEVFVSSEDGRLCVGLDVCIHVGLSHPRGQGLRRAEAERGGVVEVLRLLLGLLFVVICYEIRK